MILVLSFIDLVDVVARVVEFGYEFHCGYGLWL